MEELEAVVRNRVEAADTLQSAIAAFVATRVEHFQEQQDFFRMYVDEIGSRVRRAEAAPQPVRRDDRSAAAHPRTPHRKRGRSAVRSAKVDPAATALAVFDMTRGLVARHLLSQEPSDTARDVAFLTDLIWTGLRPSRRKQTS